MPNTGTGAARQAVDRVALLMGDERIQQFIAQNAAVVPRAQTAAELLVKDYANERDDKLAATLNRMLPALLAERVSVFFSYKAKDKLISSLIAQKLQSWSAGKLRIEHMGKLGIQDVGRDWREKIEATIPQCDWFLMLLPTPEVDRDWILYEAGYFSGRQSLAGRLVCLHHPDTKVADALGEHQSVPASLDNVRDFLDGLFHKPNWLPGMPAINPDLEDLDAKAKEIVDLIKPVGPALRTCCGPHMELAFDDAASVKGWEQLAAARVLDSNDDCRRLFGLQVPKSTFGEWVKKIEGAGTNDGWVKELAGAIHAVADGDQVPAIASTFGLPDRRRVRPSLCAVKRSGDHKVESVDLLFNVELPGATIAMDERLAALAITLQYAVLFRYQVLEQYSGRKLSGADVVAFSRAMQDLAREATRDPRFLDPDLLRRKTAALFEGEDRTIVEKMFERTGQLWRKDGKGEMDRVMVRSDARGLARLIEELTEINGKFLSVTSRRFAELMAQPGSLPAAPAITDNGRPKPRRRTNSAPRKNRRIP